MLWYKGWLETRFRILIVLVFVLFPVALRATRPRNTSAAVADEERSFPYLGFFWSLAPVMLAGAGMKTQGSLRTTKGFHGSMYFTLTMPVSRFRLLAVRAGLGMLETVAVLAVTPCAIWVMFPATRMHFSVLDFLEYWVAISVCVSFVYSLGVVFASVFDDATQNFMTMLTVFSLQVLFTNVAMPSSLNIFRAMGEASPIFTHALPWAPMGVSLGLAAVLFCVAARIVQTREY